MNVREINYFFKESGIMMQKENKILELGFQDSIIYKQSANTLFNFMRDIDFLIKDIQNMKMYPRYVVENVEYLNLKYGNRNIMNVAFPMLCFCDIHLHKLSLHVEEDISTGSKGYGKYGLGLDKKWCEERGFYPISYINKSSSKCSDLSNLLNKGLDALYKRLTYDEDFYNYILNQIRLSKPLTGHMIMGEEDIKKNFHDEREWRFLPDLSQVSMEDFINDATMPKKMSPNILKEMSNALTVEDSTHLNLTVDSIKYIFVKNLNDRKRILNVIKDTFEDDLDNALIMSSKVIVYDQIVGDW